MKIYVGHSSGFDFKTELYLPIRNSDLNKHHEIVLPHENSEEPFDSRTYLRSADVMVAEVSFPSTGLGIELGWADSNDVPILLVYREGMKISRSLSVVSEHLVSYSDTDQLITAIDSFLHSIN